MAGIIFPCSDTAFGARAVHTYFDDCEKRFGRLEEVILLDTIDTPKSALFIRSMGFFADLALSCIYPLRPGA